MADMSLHTTAATETTDPTPYVLSGGDKTATLTPYDDAVIISRQLAKTWLTGSMDEVLDKLSRHAANKIDRVIRDTNLVNSGIAQYAGAASSRGTVAQSSVYTFDVAEAREARAKLEHANVDPLVDGFYVCVGHSDSLYEFIVPLCRKAYRKFRKLLGHLSETISSQALIGKVQRLETEHPLWMMV